MVADGGTAATFAYIPSSVSGRRISVSSGAHPPTQAKASRGAERATQGNAKKPEAVRALWIFGELYRVGLGLEANVRVGDRALISVYIDQGAS